MSRKISEQITDAFLNKRSLSIDNSVSTGSELLLWGNKIAYHKDNDIIISLCGYKTNTTLERLNTLLSTVYINCYHKCIRIKKGIVYFKNKTSEFEISADKEYSLNDLMEREVTWKKEKVSLKKKNPGTESSVGKKVKCWHCGADQKIQSLESTFQCSSCKGYLWTGEGGYKIEVKDNSNEIIDYFSSNELENDLTKCDLCGAQFVVSNGFYHLENHMKLFHPDKKFMVEI